MRPWRGLLLWMRLLGSGLLGGLRRGTLPHGWSLRASPNRGRRLRLLLQRRALPVRWRRLRLLLRGRPCIIGASIADCPHFLPVDHCRRLLAAKLRDLRAAQRLPVILSEHLLTRLKGNGRRRRRRMSNNRPVSNERR